MPPGNNNRVVPGVAQQVGELFQMARTRRSASRYATGHCVRSRTHAENAHGAVRRADWRLTVPPMVTTERSDLLAAGVKKAAHIHPPLLGGQAVSGNGLCVVLEGEWFPVACGA